MNDKEKRLLERWSKLLGEPEVPKSTFESAEETEQNQKKILLDLTDFLNKVAVGPIVSPEPIVEETQTPFVKAALENGKKVTQPVFSPVEKQPQLPEKDFITKAVDTLNKTTKKDADNLTASNDPIKNEISQLKRAVADLHHFASRMSGMGGGGEVNLRYLDDVDRATINNGLYLRYNSTKKKFEFADPQLGDNDTAYLTEEVDTLNSVTTRGNTTNNTIGVHAVNLPVGSVITGESAIVANITNQLLNAVLEHGDSADLNIGDYGLPFGITGVPYVVYELKAVPSPALQINDIIGGATIPVESKILYVGSGTYNKIIITDKNFVSGAALPTENTVITFARSIVNAGLSISTISNTDITLNPGPGSQVITHADIIPYQTNIWSLGSPARRFKEVWFGTGTIYVQDEVLGNDQALGAANGNFYIKGGAGLDVGEFILRDNNLYIKNSARDVNIGTLGATADVVFNRAIKVQTSNTRTSFHVNRNGLTKILTPDTLLTNESALEIVGTSSANSRPRNFTGTLLQLTAQDGQSARVSIDSFGTNTYPVIAGRHARGTVLSPTATQQNDTLFRISTQGWGNTDYVSSIGRINIEATENFTSAAAGTRIRFQTTPTNTITIQTSSADIDYNGLSFTANPNSNAGITFKDASRLTYFPQQTGKDGKYLKVTNIGGQDIMSWESTPTITGAVVYKGLYTVSTGNTTVNDASGQAGWEYTVYGNGTVNFGNGALTLQDGDLLIHNGTHYDLIPGPRTQVNADWNANTGVAAILNKPTIIQSDWGQSNTSSIDFIKNKPNIPAAQIQSDWNQANTSSLDFIKNKPSLANGTVTSVGGTGNVSGLTLTGTVTTTGNLTLGGQIDKTSSNTYGIAKVDGTTITAANGIISAVSGVGGSQLVYSLDSVLNLSSVKNTFVSVFGLTNGVTLQTNTRYQYELVFNLQANKDGILTYALAQSGGAAIAKHNYSAYGNKTTTIIAYSAGVTLMSENATGNTIITGTEIADTKNGFAHYTILGTIDVTTGGSVNFMISQDQNTPITWSVKPGAYIKLTALGAIGNNTVVGTWA